MGDGCRRLQKIVEPYDLAPVRIFSPRRLTMQGSDRSLQNERTGAAAKRLLDQRQRLRDLLVIPAAAILLLKNDQIAGII